MERGAADPAGETDGPFRAALVTAGAGTAATTRYSSQVPVSASLPALSYLRHPLKLQEISARFSIRAPCIEARPNAGTTS